MYLFFNWLDIAQICRFFFLLVVEFVSVYAASFYVHFLYQKWMIFVSNKGSVLTIVWVIEGCIGNCEKLVRLFCKDWVIARCGIRWM